ASLADLGVATGEVFNQRLDLLDRDGLRLISIERYWSCELTLLILSIHPVWQSADQNHECENCGGEQQPSFHAGSPPETVELATWNRPAPTSVHLTNALMWPLFH